MFKSLALAAALTCAGATASSASVVINVTDTGSTLLFGFSGSMDLTGLTFDGSGPVGTGISPGVPAINIGPSGVSTYDFYNLSSVSALGAGNVGFSISGAGDVFSINISLSGAPAAFGVPVGYTGGPLSGSMTVDASDFATVGLSDGDIFDWGASNGETITVRVGSAVAAIPLPAGALLLGTALAGFGIARRRKV